MPAQPYNRTQQRWCALSARSSPSAPTTPAVRAGRDTLSYDSSVHWTRTPDNHGARRRSHNAPDRPNRWISAAVSTPAPAAEALSTLTAGTVVGLVGTQFSQPPGAPREVPVLGPRLSSPPRPRRST